MKRIVILILCSLCLVPLKAVNYCATSAWGYGAAATGGGSATPTLVQDVSGLKSISKAKNKVFIITKSITVTSMVTLQDMQNVTILALPGVILKSDKQDASSSGILFIKKSSNIILRNLTFEGPGAYDCDGNDNLCFEKVTTAWVDHCDFQDGCDGNFDNKSTTDNVTVSWCRFRYQKAPKAGGSGGADDHRFTNLLGSSSSDKPDDGTYNFTWAYCWWDEGCKERMVRCRNAELHFLNCYWNSSVANYYVGPENAKAYFEGCTFEGKANTTKTIFKSYGGTNACKFVNCSGKLPSNSGTVNAPTYTYDQLAAATAKNYVINSSCGAGATLAVNKSGQITSSCDGGSIDPDPSPIDPDPIDPTPVGGLTWNFSTSAFTALTGDITANTTVNGLSIKAASDKKVTIAASSKTIDGMNFTHVFKTNGSGSATARSLSFSVTGACTIEVYLISAKSSENRTLNIYSGSYGGTPIATMMADSTTAAKRSYSYTGGAATIYMGSANSGINIYAINVVYSSTPTPQYTLSYDENGGSGEMNEQINWEGYGLEVQPNAFTPPTGYQFKEWNDNNNGAGTKYEAGDNVTMNDDLTLYAIWQPLTYSVTLDAAGGTGGSASVTVTFDAAMPNITIPSRTNYTFLGYFDQQNGAGTQYYDANGSSTNSWVTASDATLYAAWEEQSGETPVVTGDLHFWFFYPQDATANNVTNDATVFANMYTSTSSQPGSITVDGISYAITKRSGDTQKFGEFTIPDGKTAIFYAIAVSSGGSSRQINLIRGEEKIEFEVPGGSSSYQRLESDELPAGTYSIEREGSGNVRLGVIVLKFIPDSSTAIDVIQNQSAARKVLRHGQVVIVRENKTYNLLGTRVR